MSQNSEFEKYLEGKSDLSKLYAELPEVDVPDHLDAAILAEAHRAVNSRPGAKPRHRWTIPLGMVATLFVVVMVGLQLPYILKDAAQTQQLNEERIAALMDKNTAEPSSVEPVEAMKNALMAKQKSENLRGEPAPMAAEAPAKPKAPAVVAPQALPAAETGQLGATSVLASPPVASPSPIPARAAKRLELRESADVESGEALAKEKKISGHATGNVSDSLEQHAPAAARMAAPPPAQLNRSLMQPLKDESNEANLRPEDWLLRIKKLKQEGKLEEAKKELVAFKKRYPDYSVPEAFEVR